MNTLKLKTLPLKASIYKHLEKLGLKLKQDTAYTPISSTESAKIPEDILKMLKDAKSGTWYDGWQPYCGMCNTMARMRRHDYGFQCCI